MVKENNAPYFRDYKLVESTAVTTKHGDAINEIIRTWQQKQLINGDDSLEPPTLQTIANQLGISRERVRQICLQENIQKPQARRGTKRTREQSICKDCGNTLPFRKSSYVSISRCPVCNPTHVTIECSNCGDEFTILQSVYKARLRKEKGYKGNLYCSRECFYNRQSKNKWWESSPTREIMKEKQVSMPEAVEILKNTYDS